MARKRKAVKQKEMDPVTQEIYDLLHDNNNNIAVEVVTAEYEIPTPYIDVTKLPPVLDTSKLPSLEEVEVVEEADVVEVPSVIETPLYTDPSLKQLFDLIEEFCK